MMVFLYLLCLMISVDINAATYTYNQNADLIGELQYHNIRAGDSWESISYHYETGYDELRDANPHITTVQHHIGEPLLIPTLYVLPKKEDRQGVVVSLAEKRLYYFPKKLPVVFTYPVSIGKKDWKTTEFKGTIIRKRKAPTWNVPTSIKNYYQEKYNITLEDQVGPGENNPLGNFALYTSQEGILVHGTNNEKLIGREVSSGCVRMYNQNIQELYHLVDPYEKIHIVDMDEKVGKINDEIFYEQHDSYINEDNDTEKLLEELPEQSTIKVHVYTTGKANGVPEKIGYYD